MRQSTYLAPTMRDVPADADAISHKLMLRAGMMRQIASGVYAYLPLAKRSMAKIETIIREELDAIGAQELTLPALHPAELWQQSGRWEAMGDELVRLKDRHNRDFALGPTHEEVITSLIKDGIASYKKLPLNVYQIQTKFRDERRPRFGLLRGREFIMKDAYSFHDTEESLNETYWAMHKAYSRIFTRVGLTFRPVIADSGAMGGKDTHEFMALASVGEDTVAYSDQSDYAANLEMASSARPTPPASQTHGQLEKQATPDAKTVNDAAEQLGLEADDILKALVVVIAEEVNLLLLRGNDELNEVKALHELGATSLRMATEEEVLQAFGATPGSIGPVGVSDIPIYADYRIQAMDKIACGANETGVHYVHVGPGRDYQVTAYKDLRTVQAGDPSPDGQGTLQFAEGIEIGQVFKLGTRYSESLDAKFLDANGKAQPFLMGCYGIGVSRTIAAVIEQHHDENGIVWPNEVAPFHVHLLALNVKNDEQKALSEKLYELIRSKGMDVLYDDRPERAGVKFKDSDLIGLPVRIAVGKRAAEEIVEVKVRKTGEQLELTVPELASWLSEFFTK
ncbi:prolyl-tRNA synthetase [Alkalihalobacillus xiaoxiensis]|uniref:Proline--tRNA ligase n=1 Tax=Shouchella xiaoxiensis TaxID=766895 RepID=A0ABS2SQ77_9BACI|nr:proline--tRNA ligase [Shouchella xiaoxiensis]MBM7837682.1 prolyl-tRNA synthetase [Shouchella xiaoxiensis]